MIIDNTMFTAYSFCPRFYFERYEYALEDLSKVSGVPSDELPVHNVREVSKGIERDEARPDRDFGSRFHQLTENRRRKFLSLEPIQYPRWPDDAIEAEAQATFAAYEAAYPVDYEFLEAERVHVIPLPGPPGADGQPHRLAVKIDAVVRHSDGTIGPLDTKTERSGSQANNPESWASRTQASLYLWALEKLHMGEVSRLVVDVVTRGNTKRGPIFRRMDDISRSQEQLDDAIRCVSRVVSDIERDRVSNFWRANMNKCLDGWKKCEFFPLHVYGKTEANLKLYRPAEDYLGLP